MIIHNVSHSFNSFLLLFQSSHVGQWQLEIDPTQLIDFILSCNTEFVDSFLSGQKPF